MISGFVWWVFWLACAMSLVASIETYVCYRRARVAPYFFIRREARHKAMGWATAALLFFASGVILLPGPFW